MNDQPQNSTLNDPNRQNAALDATMALHSEFHMPGAFHEGGVHPGIFRAPHDGPPSAASSGYLPSRPSNDDHATPKRKRFNHDVSGARPEGKSYSLAGRIDTPSAVADKDDDAMGESMFSDGDFRRQLGTKRPRDTSMLDSTDERMFRVPLAQQPQAQAPTQGWGSFAASVVGKIWEFCKPGAFRGFHAGVGRGYDLQPSVDDVSMLQSDFDHEEHRQVPGRYPGAEWSEKENEAYANSRASTPTGPAVKRRQTTAPKDDLGKNWVMVSEAGRMNSRAGTPEAGRRASHIPSPRNRNYTPSVTTGRRISTPASRRMAPRQSMASTPTTNRDPERPRPASSASFASQRSPSPSPTKISTPTQPVLSTPKTTNSARRHRPSHSINTTPSHRRTTSNVTPSHRRTTSTASAATPRGSQQQSSFEGSPRLTEEARKLAAKRRKADEYANYRVTGLNDTVMDLIRQGQEALATTVDVEGTGWEDDD